MLCEYFAKERSFGFWRCDVFANPDEIEERSDEPSEIDSKSINEAENCDKPSCWAISLRTPEESLSLMFPTELINVQFWIFYTEIT